MLGSRAHWVNRLNRRGLSSIVNRDAGSRLSFQALTATFTVMALAMAACGGTSHLESSSSSVGEVDIDPNSAVTEDLAVGTAPTAMALDGEYLWVANTLDGTVSRVDTGDGHVVDTIAVGMTPLDIEVAEGLVWVVDNGAAAANISGEVGALVAIDPATGDIATVDLGPGPSSVSVVDGQAWVTDRVAGTVSIVDTEDMTISDVIDLGETSLPGDSVVVGRDLWIPTFPSELVRIPVEQPAEPETVSIDGGESFQFQAGSLAVDNEDIIWTATSGAEYSEEYGIVLRCCADDLGNDDEAGVSLSQADVIPTSPEITGASSIAFGRDDVWVTVPQQNEVYQYDRSAFLEGSDWDPVSRYPVGAGPTDILVGAGAVWVSNTDDGTVTRIGGRGILDSQASPSTTAGQRTGDDALLADEYCSAFSDFVELAPFGGLVTESTPDSDITDPAELLIVARDLKEKAERLDAIFAELEVTELETLSDCMVLGDVGRTGLQVSVRHIEEKAALAGTELEARGYG